MVRAHFSSEGTCSSCYRRSRKGTFAFSAGDGQCCQPGAWKFAATEGGNTETGIGRSEDETQTARKYCNCAAAGRPAHGITLSLLEILPAQLLREPVLLPRSPLLCLFSQAGRENKY